MFSNNPNRTRRVRRVTVLATMMGLSLASVASAGQSTPVPSDGPVVTTPADTSARPAGSALDSPEVAMYAKEMGWTNQRALDVLDGQAVLTKFAESVRGTPEYVDFKVTPNDVTGVLMVEPGLNMKTPFASATVPAKVQVISAAAPRAQRDALLQQITDRAVATGGESVGAVSYDAFTNSYTVSVFAQSKVAKPTTADLMATTANARSATAATVQVVELQPSSVFRGGQLATKPVTGGTASCTTGFGVRSATLNSNGYLTAGHCGTGTWTINGNTSSLIGDRQYGGYDDHQVIRGTGASYFVRISPTVNEVDMSSTAGHIFLGVRYCNYGQFSNQMYCGTITKQNVDSLDPDGTITKTSESTARCRPGDSGGPVWKPGTERQPTGLIHGGDTGVAPVAGNWPCRYVALDDQLVGGGCALL